MSLVISGQLWWKTNLKQGVTGNFHSNMIRVSPRRLAWHRITAWHWPISGNHWSKFYARLVLFLYHINLVTIFKIFFCVFDQINCLAGICFTRNGFGIIKTKHLKPNNGQQCYQNQCIFQNLLKFCEYSFCSTFHLNYSYSCTTVFFSYLKLNSLTCLSMFHLPVAM